jgi:hypothetical protein
MKKTIERGRRKLSLQSLTIRALRERAHGGGDIDGGDGGELTGYCTCRCSICCPSGAANECPGRPLVVDGEVRVAPVEERDDWAD